MDKTPDDVQEKIRDILGSSIFYSKQDCKWVLIEAYPGSLTKAISALLSQELAKRDEEWAGWIRSRPWGTTADFNTNEIYATYGMFDERDLEARLKEINNEYTVGIYRSGNTDSHCTVGSVGVR